MPHTASPRKAILVSNSFRCSHLFTGFAAFITAGPKSERGKQVNVSLHISDLPEVLRAATVLSKGLGAAGKVAHGAGIALRENGNDGYTRVEEDADGIVTVIVADVPPERVRFLYLKGAEAEPQLRPEGRPATLDVPSELDKILDTVPDEFDRHWNASEQVASRLRQPLLDLIARAQGQ